MAITLKMKKEDYEKILAHCQAGFPNESCGLLAGDIDGEVKSITEVYLLTNIDASNEHFSMDPKEQLAAVKDARAKGKKLIGNFHSHPESPSRPSEEDKRLAYDSTMESCLCRRQTIRCSRHSGLIRIRMLRSMRLNIYKGIRKIFLNAPE